jgi:hypothetical protein
MVNDKRLQLFQLFDTFVANNNFWRSRYTNQSSGRKGSPMNCPSQTTLAAPVTANLYQPSTNADGAWTLYVNSASALSLRALENLRKLIASGSKSGREVKVVDLFQNPELAEDAKIYVLPTLLWSASQGRSLVLLGDLSKLDKVAHYLSH